MAFQVGHIKFSGTVDGLSFYNSQFGWLIRKCGGPTTNQFKNSIAFKLARNNSNEFTLCARTAAAIRTLVYNHTGKKDPTLYHRLIKLMRLLANEDKSSKHGQRHPLKGMHSYKAKQLLLNFKIRNDISLFTILLNAHIIKRSSLKPLVKIRISNSFKNRQFTRSRKSPIPAYNATLSFLHSSPRSVP